MPLSPKEKRILDWFDEGKSYKEICALEKISLNTLKTHARKITAKARARSLREAAYKLRSAYVNTVCGKSGDA